jgi:hypothetical protein
MQCARSFLIIYISLFHVPLSVQLEKPFTVETYIYRYMTNKSLSLDSFSIIAGHNFSLICTLSVGKIT